DDPRKGGAYLLKALRIICDEAPQLMSRFTLATFGSKGSFDPSTLPIEWIHVGRVTDDRVVRLLFQAADVFACPSIDDVGPMMINEAFMCGTPVVAFDSGVAPDLIRHPHQGFVVGGFDVSQFARGLIKAAEITSAERARPEPSPGAPYCSPQRQADHYLKLFSELVTTPSSRASVE
ncbi:glycosyltransferase, partial [Rhodothermus sp. AH-315-K08]|nr:glycosyltransferase [Rhodothermus sp. AH-315-K08]